MTVVPIEYQCLLGTANQTSEQGMKSNTLGT